MISYLLIGFVVGAALGAVILYFVLKSSMVSRNSHDELNNLFIKNSSDLENSNREISKLSETIIAEKQINQQQTDILNDLKNEFAKMSAENSAQNQKIEELKVLVDKLIKENSK